MKRKSFGYGLLVGGLIMATPLTAFSAPCALELSIPGDRAFQFQANEWVKMDSTSVEPRFTNFGSVYNNSSTGSLKLGLDLLGNYPPHESSTPIDIMTVWIKLWDAAASPATCTMMTYDKYLSGVQLDSVTSTCEMILETQPLNTQGVYGYVQCTLPPKIGSPAKYSEIIYTKELQWFQ